MSKTLKSLDELFPPIPKRYSIKECEDVLDKYTQLGGETYTVEEGSLGLGTIIGTGEGLKSIVIEEHYGNCWSSYHTISLYDELPEKYQELLSSYE